MKQDDADEDFWRAGFLGQATVLNVPAIREKSAEWFTLADDASLALQDCCRFGIQTAQGTSMEPATVATRLLIRSAQSFQGVVLMAERGMATEGQMLARSLFENAFCMAALLGDPIRFIELLKEDAEAARRLQGEFVLAQGMANSREPEIKARLEEVVDAIGKAPRTLSPKKLAMLGPLVKQYLSYQKLSNDSAHPSAASLFRHIVTLNEGAGWNYRWGFAGKNEIAFTLYQAIFAAVPLGIGYTEMLKAEAVNETFSALAARMQALPPPDGSLAAASRVT